MNKLTDKQKDTYDFIIKFFKENYKFPTIREIGNIYGISTRAVWDRVDGLRKKGYITTVRESRGMKLEKYRVEIILHDK